jgi:tRNA (guanine-N7-)-methyltransferase
VAGQGGGRTVDGARSRGYFPAALEQVPRDYVSIAPRAPEGSIDLRVVFGAEAPVELDIGFGKGMSIFERARIAPGAQILGIEIKSKLGYQVAERVTRLGLSSIRIWAGDVKEILPRVGPAGSVVRASVHFPDPWWKKRHTKRRVVGGVLLDELARLIAPGGQLFVQTDVEDRAEDYLEEIRADGRFTLDGDGLVEANPFGSISNRERRAIADGLPVWRILATRV